MNGNDLAAVLCTIDNGDLTVVYDGEKPLECRMSDIRLHGSVLSVKTRGFVYLLNLDRIISITGKAIEK